LPKSVRGGRGGGNPVAAPFPGGGETYKKIRGAVPDSAWIPEPYAAGPRGHGTGVRVLPGEAQAAGWRAAGVVLKRIYLSLGSNIGDREGNLRKAVERLASQDVRVLHT